MTPVTPVVMRTPRTLEIEITTQCNLRCRYCSFFNNSTPKREERSTQEWLTFFDELGRQRIMDVTLSGGEAFSRSDIKILIDAIIKNRMRFQTLSNGALIDDDLAQYLADTQRCNHVQVSLDGANAETHDICRGCGSFEGAVRGIRTLQKHAVPVTVRVTIHRHNVYELEAIAHFLLDELGLSAFSTNAAGYLGTCRLNADDILLTTAERQLAMQTLAALDQQFPGRIQANAGPLADSRMWQKMVLAHQHQEPPFAHGGRLTACGCVFNKLAVRADGHFIPCTLLPHLDLGEINADRLTEVWLNHPALNAMRQRRQIPLEQFSACQSCDYRPYCTGNCPALAYTLTGQVDHPSPDACLQSFLKDGGQVEAAYTPAL